MAFMFDATVDTRATQAVLGEIGARSVAMQPAMYAVQKLMRGGFERNFASEGGTFGEPWRPLAPGTLALKARRGQTGILRGTGALQQALGGGTGKYGRVTASSSRAGVGGPVFYARFHNFGTEKMPRRRVLGIDEQTRAKSVGIVQKYLVGGPL